MPKKIRTFQSYSENEMNSFACIFHGFQGLIDFTLSIENHVKL